MKKSNEVKECDEVMEEKVLQLISNKFKVRRKECKITQRELAKITGVSYGSIKRFEQSNEISLSSLIKIADIVGCLNDFEYLFSSKKDAKGTLSFVFDENIQGFRLSKTN